MGSPAKFLAFAFLPWLLAASAAPAQNPPLGPIFTGIDAKRWPVEKAWAWRRGQPWPCGFNYVPANAISYTEMFMDYNFDPVRIDRELAAAQGVGFNCARIVLPFVVWEHDPAAFRGRFNDFLTICEKHGIKVLPTLFDDCIFGPIADPVYGQQPEVVPGWYANGWTPSPGRAITSRPEQWGRMEKYVRDILKTFKDDRRILLWDLYNEPANDTPEPASLGNVSLVSKVFDWTREIALTQPVTVAASGGPEMQALALRRSDIISFHHYGPAQDLAGNIADLKRAGRPVICSEWLNRNGGSTVADCLPLFVAEDVGCLNWGLVVGRTQTDLSRGHRPGQPLPRFWQHDLFRADYTPYDPAEIDLFKRLIAAAAVLRAQLQPPTTATRTQAPR